MRLLLLAVTVSLLSGCFASNVSNDSNQAGLLNTQLGYGYLEQGRGDLALDKFAKALTNTPEMLEARLGYAAALSSTGKYEAAESYYREVLADHSTSLQVVERFAGFLCTQERFVKAEKIIISALRNNVYEHAGEAYTRFSACALAVGEPSSAALYADHAIRSEPGYAPAFIQKGWVELSQDRPAAALNLVYQVEALAPASAESLVLGLKAAKALKHPDEDRFNSQLRIRFPAVWRETQRAE